MKTVQCPDLDQLAESLVRAYRNAEDRDLFLISDDADSEIGRIHKMMADHRSGCQLCVHISRLVKIEVMQRQLHKQTVKQPVHKQH